MLMSYFCKKARELVEASKGNVLTVNVSKMCSEYNNGSPRVCVLGLVYVIKSIAQTKGFDVYYKRGRFIMKKAEFAELLKELCSEP